MLKFLPTGFLGLMIAGMLAAYVSTISTHLNWGTSYLVHDVYRRFVSPGESEKHYVMVGRLVTAALMVLAAGLTFVLESARQSFELLMSIGAGTGLLYLLRWFWWRVTAWCEIAAMVTSFAVALGFFLANASGASIPSHITLIIGVGITTVVWIAVAYVGPATDRDTLESFYRLVRPAGPGWNLIRSRTGLAPSTDSLPMAMLGWVLGCAFVYAALFGAGSFLYGLRTQGFVWLAVLAVSGIGLGRILPRIWRSGGA
jgi:solute:Na+ symporter, SSS family